MKLKKTIAILLTFLFFLTSTNYIFLFIERLETIKSQMQERVLSEYNGPNITILNFSFADYESKLRWLDTNEFELEGKMYDVIRIEESNNEFTIYCLNDVKEEKLISNYNNLNNINGNHKSFVTVHHQSLVLYAVKNESAFVEKIKSINPQSCISGSNYNSVSLDITTPPPRKIS